jgi:hypothetical protein
VWAAQSTPSRRGELGVDVAFPLLPRGAPLSHGGPTCAAGWWQVASQQHEHQHHLAARVRGTDLAHDACEGGGGVLFRTTW